MRSSRSPANAASGRPSASATSRSATTAGRRPGSDDAIALANDTEYGLVAYVYTSDLKTGLRISERLESGMIALNRGLVSDAAAPFGGVKQSGLGREGSHHGIREFTEAKYIAVDW